LRYIYSAQNHYNMPQNNLLSEKYFLFCFFLVGVFAFSQSPIGIKSSVGEYYSISLCEGDVVTFTLDSFTIAPTSGENYIFYLAIHSCLPTAP